MGESSTLKSALLTSCLSQLHNNTCVQGDLLVCACIIANYHIAPVCQLAACDGQGVVIRCQQLAKHAQVAGQVPVVWELSKLLVGTTL